MIKSFVTRGSEENKEEAIWSSLRLAISKSSGFQRWQTEQDFPKLDNLDLAVRLYLKETLETLAY